MLPCITCFFHTDHDGTPRKRYFQILLRVVLAQVRHIQFCEARDVARGPLVLPLAVAWTFSVLPRLRAAFGPGIFCPRLSAPSSRRSYGVTNPKPRDCFVMRCFWITASWTAENRPKYSCKSSLHVTMLRPPTNNFVGFVSSPGNGSGDP